MTPINMRTQPVIINAADISPTDILFGADSQAAASPVVYTFGALKDFIGAVAGAVTSVAGKTGVVALIKADVGLSVVDNTADSSKPVSTAQAAALAVKENTGVAAGLISTHAALSDPHSQYARDDEKGAANGIATLGADGILTLAQRGAGGGGVSAHSALTGLTTDDHTQYLTNARFDTRFGTTSIDALSDVATAGALVNQALRWNGTAYVPAADPAGAGVTDGNKTDITVSASGATWVVNANAITLAKMANITTASFLGRVTATTGVVEVLSAAQVKTALALVKADVGLGSVDNTADASKPVSTAQAAADNLRILATEKGAVNGVATLGADGILTLAQRAPGGGGGGGGGENTVNRRRYATFFDEMVGGKANGNSAFPIGEIWRLACTGDGSNAMFSYALGSEGGAYFRKGTTATGKSGLGPDEQSIGGGTPNGPNVRLTWEFRGQFRPLEQDFLPDATDNFISWFGKGNPNTGDISLFGTACIALRWSGSAAELIARSVPGSGGAVTTILSLPTSGVDATYRVVCNGQTNVEFFVNDVLVATHAGVLPEWGESRHSMGIYGIAGTAQRSLLARRFVHIREII